LLLCAVLLFLCFNCLGQIPHKAKTIIVKEVTFSEVLNKLLDEGYQIESKDNDLGLVTTAPTAYKKHFNAAYKIIVRMKGSAAHFSGVYASPWETTFSSLLVGQTVQKGNFDSPAMFITDRKGRPAAKTMPCYPFLIIEELAKSFGKEIEYN
jgi:hypothetical protein